MLEDIPKRWKVLSGQNKWKGLLDPLDSDLRRYLIHYGEMAQVGYDAFNWDRKSEYCGDCYYSKSQIHARTGYLKANPIRYFPTNNVSSLCRRCKGKLWLILQVQRDQVHLRNSFYKDATLFHRQVFVKESVTRAD